jgi:hypothetical protein
MHGLNVMEEIYSAFPIFANGTESMYKTIDSALGREEDPERINKIYLRFIYGKHGLRANIQTYLAKQFPPIDFDLQELFCDRAIEGIENRFRDRYEVARCA